MNFNSFGYLLFVNLILTVYLVKNAFKLSRMREMSF
jgi:hypothetical protein